MQPVGDICFGSPPYEGGVDAAAADGVVLSSPIMSAANAKERTTPAFGHPSFSKEGSFEKAGFSLTAAAKTQTMNYIFSNAFHCQVV